MTTRTSAKVSFNSGTFVPKKYDEVRITYVSPTEALYQYYADECFLSGVRVTLDSQGRETNIKLLIEEV